MFFNSNTEKNRLRKEMNKLLSKEMILILLKKEKGLENK